VGNITAAPVPAPAPVISDPLNTQDETDTVLEFINSSKLSSPQGGVFVGHLYEIPPPKRLQVEWRQKGRADLREDLKMATLSLPSSLSRAETAIEAELCMSGILLEGRQTVALRPTIWIHCGSKRCQKVVQQAVADLRHPQRFPIIVTRGAPIPAALVRRPVRLVDNVHLIPTDAIDEILPVVSTGSTTHAEQYPEKQIVGGGTLEIEVQSILQNNSACGLPVRLRTHNGDTYICTIGGMVTLNDTLLGLTTAHAIWDSAFYKEEHIPGSLAETQHRVFGPAYSPPPISFLRRGAPWSPAALHAASYGASFASEAPAISAATTSGHAHNQDFALLYFEIDQGRTVSNEYWTSLGPQTVNKTSQDLSERTVKLICSPNDVKEGQLLDDDCVIMDNAGCWETRKIQLKETLGESFLWH
jgi:hypothetical protein